MMENRISDTDERKLANAIESAATLASNDMSRDRSVTLAGQLKEAGVDPRFAKVASAAFNKRLTVLTFKKTADEHKADPFELADADKVLELMTGESLEKAASVPDTFEITYTQKGEMQKAASAETPVRALYEDTVQYDALVRHVEGIMEKNAAALQDLVYKYDDVKHQADVESTELADYFMKSAGASFEFDTLVNAYGDRFKNAIADKLPAGTEFTKTAGGAITPDTPLYRKASSMITSHEAAENLKVALDYYGKGLSQLCKAASDLGDLIRDLEFNLSKDAALIDNGQETITELGMLPGMVVGGAADAANKFVNGITATTGNILGNSYALYQAGNSAHMAPNEILDAEFLTKDRYRDRLLGWSDMTADPQFAMYPAEQVFLATQKAMDMDTTLERPDRREVLRSYVAQLLAQNNRLSTADIAALAQTLRGLADDDKANLGRNAIVAVKSMDEVKAPELPKLNPIVEGTVTIDNSKNTENAVKDMEKSLEEFTKSRDKKGDKDEKEKENKETAKNNKAQLLASARDARTRFLRDAMNIQIAPGAKGALTYTGPSGTLDQATIDQILSNAEKANLVPALPA